MALIDRVDAQAGYRLNLALAQQRLAGNADDLLVVLAFSGGGTRAAALGYGVLEEMRQQRFTWQGKPTSLFDQVDLTFGVSGGAILSTYYALHGADLFAHFERRFLKQNLQRALWRQFFTLGNWPRLTSPEFGRGELFQEQLERTLFHHATFDDLTQRRKGPMTVISATDMSNGARLDFIQDSFDVLCLDLSQMPLARAVAASSAVPLVFAPITIDNNGGRCGYRIAQELEQSVAMGAAQPLLQQTRLELLQERLRYEAAGHHPYVHLLDGGLTDNLALRAMLDYIQMYGQQGSMYQNMARARKVVFISVNAQNQATDAMDMHAAVPGTRSVVQALINIPIDRNSQESLRQLRAFVERWRAEQAQLAASTGAPPGAQIYFISLELKKLHNPWLRSALLGVPTSLYLPAQQIDHLKAAGAELLRQSPEFGRLQSDLGMAPEAGAAP